MQQKPQSCMKNGRAVHLGVNFHLYQYNFLRPSDAFDKLGMFQNWKRWQKYKFPDGKNTTHG